MAVTWCGHCRMPLTPEEAAAGVCPMCGSQLCGVAPPSAKRQTTPVAKPPAPSSDSWWPVAFVIVLLVTSLIAHAVFTPDVVPVAPGKPGPVVLAKGIDWRDHQLAVRQLTPRENDAGPSEEERMPVTEFARQSAAKPKGIKPAPLIKFPQIFENGVERTLELPEGQYRATINNRTRLKLKGVVKTLKVDLVETDAELDATGLEAQEIILGRILGRSRVKLKGIAKSLTVDMLENGSELDASSLEAGEISMGRILSRSRVKLLASDKVEIRGLIDNYSSVFVNAPKGDVIFSGRIDNAVVVLFAKEVDFRGTLAGNNLQVLTTLTGGGKLKFREITAGARLLYRKANAADPEPVIQSGIIAGNAKLIKGK